MAKTTIIEKLKKAFRRDILSYYPEDIARPHDKIVTYILKAIGISLFVFGAFFLVKAGNTYVIYREIIKSEYPFTETKFDVFGANINQQKFLTESKGFLEQLAVSSESESLEVEKTDINKSIVNILKTLKQDELSKLKADLVDLITVFSFMSFGLLLSSLFIGSVIILRYIARVLPDRIYLRFGSQGNAFNPGKPKNKSK